MAYDPWQFPENPFDYSALVSRKTGIGKIPDHKFGTKIGIIGAGCAGLCAAYELMKIGLHPVVYESAGYHDGTPRIGGRAYTYRFPGDPRAFAELGAMRIPPVHKTVAYYMDQFGIDFSQPFPDPLVVPTTLYFKGKKYFIPLGGKLPGPFQKASDAWGKLVDPLVEKMDKVWDHQDQRGRQWEEYVDLYADKSFFQVLCEHGLSRQELQLFGALGLGTGGFDSIYPVSFLEILRLVICKWEINQRIVKGGIQQIPDNFWTRERNCSYQGRTSVKKMNKGIPSGAVKEIYTSPDHKGKIHITDINGDTEAYDAVIVTCSHRALETDIKVSEGTFSSEVWTAIKNIHMTRSGKVFVRTKQAFWKNCAPEKTLTCTITDDLIRGTYLFDFDDTDSGVICLSYTWEDSATKLHALSEQERVKKSLDSLAHIYGKDFISDQVMETKSFFWEHEKGYNGAFKLNYPGQYEDQKILFEQSRLKTTISSGVFLSGESTSWAGGWIEGALHSGLDAAMAVVRWIGGEIECSNTND